MKVGEDYEQSSNPGRDRNKIKEDALREIMWTSILEIRRIGDETLDQGVG